MGSDINAHNNKDSITAFILAGGLSSRLGQEKGLVKVRGFPLISFPLKTVLALTQSAYIIGPPRKYRRLGFPVIPDSVKSRGPLSGLFTALQTSPTPLIILLACDMPKVSPSFLELLWRRIQGADAAIVRRLDGTVEPLCGIYSKQCLPQVRLALDSGNCSLNDLLCKLQICFLEEDEFAQLHFSSSIFENINTPTDLNRLRKERQFLAAPASTKSGILLP
jgi:molybdopterin-guanine dinucleotide biosynthesis protein A